MVSIVTRRSLHRGRSFSFCLLFFIFSLLTIPSSLPAAQPGEGSHLFDFESKGEIANWQVVRGSLAAKGGVLLINEGFFPVLYSPGSLDIPASESLLQFSYRGAVRGTCEITIFSSSAPRGIKKKFYLDGDSAGARSNGGQWHKREIYIGNILSKDDRILAFNLTFPGRIKGLEIDSIGFQEPGGAGLAKAVWFSFLEREPIGTGSINYINSPLIGSWHFMTLLYIFIGLAFLIIVLYLIVRKKAVLGRRTAINAVVAAFILASLLFALRMDYNWVRLYCSDLKDFSGKSEKERISALYMGASDDFFSFIEAIKQKLPPGEMARPAGRPIADPRYNPALMLRYYLLPKKSSAEARYVWVYYDRAISYDPALRVLRQNGRLIERDVVPVLSTEPAAVLYRVGGGA